MSVSTASPVPEELRGRDDLRTADFRRRPSRSSSIVDKLVMGVTGTILVLFVLFHLYGNLKLFLGRTDIDEYARWLHDFGQPILPGQSFLWLFRGIIGLTLTLHILYGLRLAARNRAARPVRYAHRPAVHRRGPALTFAARTMPWTGLLLLVFLVFHILDQVVGKPVNGSFLSGHPSNNVIMSLERWPVAALYLAVIGVLGLHLVHGTWSLFTSLGWRGRRLDGVRRVVATAVPLVLVVGNASLPIAVLAGWVK